LAKRATRTFSRVYDVAHPEMLHYEGTSIRFPTLLIKRRVPEPVFRFSETAPDAREQPQPPEHG
jgi:hypothetical protein